MPFCAYFFLLVRPRYVADFKYLFAVNVYIQPTTVSGWIAPFWYAFHAGLWVEPTLCIVAAITIVTTGRPIKPRTVSATPAAA